MLRRTLAKVAKYAIIVKAKLPMRRKNMARHHQNDFDNDEFDDFDDEDEHHEKKIKKKSKKVNIDIVRRRLYCQNCFNEGHFTKECKLLMKFYRICRASDHNTYRCPSKVVNGSFLSREIISIHVIQTKVPRR
jgi:hypothetical protein